MQPVDEGAQRESFAGRDQADRNKWKIMNV